MESLALILAAAAILYAIALFIHRDKGPPPCPDWEAGPTIRNFYYSPGVPRCNDGSFAIPAKPGEIGYLTRKTGPLDGFAALVIEYELTGPIYATETDRPGGMWAYIEHDDNDWTVKDENEPDAWHRAWAKGLPLPTEPGRRTVTIPLTADLWGPVLGGRTSNPVRFADLLRNAKRIGITFGGGGGGLGHGVYSDAGAHFTVHKMEAV